MIGKKINQLATELAPVSTDLTIIGDPDSGVSKKITLAQLGAIFSGAVSFYTDLASFPATGDINVIYCAKDTQKLYLWSGSAYTEVFPSQALLDTYQLRSEKGNANGYASLDSQGKVPISQLPSSIMEYKGTWNASTNTPTLANGTGDTGDVYICNVAGTVNFGAGPITFAVGDYVIYSGTIWQRSSGAVGTVTSVAASITGDSVTISGSPVTTSGTLAFAFAGTGAQYIKGDGTLATFPTSLISGTGNVNAIPKFTANTVLGNSVMEDDGNFVSMRGLKLNTIGGTGNTINFQQGSGIIAAGLGYSSIGAVGSTGIQFYLDQNVTERIFVLDTSTITSNTARTYSMPDSSGTLALTSDIPSLTGYVPYTGATTNVNLGTHSLSAYDLIIDHTSGSGVAASITKGGNGEALTVVKSSGTGNAASITGGVTLLSELHLTTDLADTYIASATNWNTAYNSRIVSVVAPLTFSLNTLGITQATGSSNGYLSSADWTTFNNKQSALTNPVTGTGTTNYLPKFTGTSTIGNSIVSDNGSRILINTGTTNQNTTINASKIAMSRTSDGAEVVYFLKNTDLGSDGTANIHGYDGIQFRTQGAETVKATLSASGNLGLGVTPSAWNSGYKVMDVSAWGSIAGEFGTQGTISLVSNCFANSTGYNNWTYVNTAPATRYKQYNGEHQWYNAPSGTAGNAISFTQAMTLNASGNLSIGNTNDTYKLDVTGTGRFTSNLRMEGAAQFWFNGSFRGQIVNYGAYAGTTDWSPFFTSETSLAFGVGGNATKALDIASTGAATFSSSVTQSASDSRLLGGDTAGRYIISNSDTSAYMAIYGSSSATANQIGIITNSLITFNTGSGYAERMRITSAGNVGIGTSSPVYKFVVSKGGAEGIEFDAGNIVAGKNYIINYNRSTSAYTDFEIAANNTIFSTAGSERMRITSTGDLLFKGASTTSLAEAVFQNSNSAVSIYGSQTGSIVKDITFHSGGTAGLERMRITSGGNVGIGTTSPNRLLTIKNSSDGVNGIGFQNHASTAELGYIRYEQTNDILDIVNNSGYASGGIKLSTSGVERMRITSGGDLYIGASSGARGGGTTKVLTKMGLSQVYFELQGNTTSTDTGLLFSHASTGAYGLLTYDSSDNMLFYSNSNERMRITSGGLVGIGTTSPAGKLHVATGGINEIWSESTIAGNNATFISKTTTRKWGIGANMALSNSSFEIYDYTAGANRLTIDSSGYFGIGTTSPQTELHVKASSGWAEIRIDGASGSAASLEYYSNGMKLGDLYCDTSANMIFRNNVSNERMRITNVGDVLVNATMTTQSAKFYVNGKGAFGSLYIANLSTGTVYSNMGNLTNTNPSDFRLKNTIKPLTYGLNEVLQLNPKTFYYNDDATKARLKYGFIAQEVKEVMPDIVRRLGSDNDYLGLETEGIYVALVNAIKELKQELDILKNK